MDVNTKNMKLVLRFLKETKLLPLFMEYVYEIQKKSGKFAKKHWSIADYPVSVLGQTRFTEFLHKKGIMLPKNLKTYQLFALWLKKINYPFYQFLMHDYVLREIERICDDTNIDEFFKVDVKRKRTFLKLKKC